MFAGPGKPAGATANNYPRADTSHVAATCSPRLTLVAHLAATVAHPRRRRPRAGGGKRPPGRARDTHGDSRRVRDRPPRARSHGRVQHVAPVTTDCPPARFRCLLPPPSGLTAASDDRPEFRRGALYQRPAEPRARAPPPAPTAAPRAKFERHRGDASNLVVTINRRR